MAVILRQQDTSAMGCLSYRCNDDYDYISYKSLIIFFIIVVIGFYHNNNKQNDNNINN